MRLSGGSSARLVTAWLPSSRARLRLFAAPFRCKKSLGSAKRNWRRDEPTGVMLMSVKDELKRRKRVDEALRESEERFRNLVEESCRHSEAGVIESLRPVHGEGERDSTSQRSRRFWRKPCPVGSRDRIGRNNRRKRPTACDTGSRLRRLYLGGECEEAPPGKRSCH